MAATDSADINDAAPPPAVGRPDFVGRARELRALLTALESPIAARAALCCWWASQVSERRAQPRS